MDRIYPDNCIPASIQMNLGEFETDRDLIYLGRENLLYLANFWKSRMEKFIAKRNSETSIIKRGEYDREVELCVARQNYLRSAASRSRPKPLLFEKQVFHIGTKVTCFLPDPDRYVSGTIAKIHYDEESETGSFSIRVYDKNIPTKYYDLLYTPDGFSMFLTSDFEYFCDHPDFFRYVLDYRFKASTPSEIAYIERLVSALPQSAATPEPPDIA